MLDEGGCDEAGRDDDVARRFDASSGARLLAPPGGEGDREVARLLGLLRHSPTYFIRRVETVRLHGELDRSWHIRVTLEVPRFGDERGSAAVGSVVSLGLFPKERLPDLEARGPDGRSLTLLGHEVTSRILAGVLAARLVGVVTRGLAERQVPAPPGASSTLDAFHELVAKVLGAYLTAASGDAVVILGALRAELARVGRVEVEPASPPDGAAPGDGADERLTWLEEIYREAHGADEVWDALEPLRAVTHVLAVVEAVPGQQLEITLDYSDQGDRPGLRVLARSAEESGSVVCRWVDTVVPVIVAVPFWALGALGLIGRGVLLSRLNADHCRSFYLMLDLPPDVQCVRFMWRRHQRRQVQRSKPPVASQQPVLTTAWLSDVDRAACHECVAELQAARSGRLRIAAWLALLSAVIWGYLGRNAVAPGSASDVATIVVLLPGAALTWLTQLGSPLEHRLTRFLRLLFGVAAVTGVAAAFLLAVIDPPVPHHVAERLVDAARSCLDGIVPSVADRPSSFEQDGLKQDLAQLVAILASVVSFAVAGLLALVLVLPRFADRRRRSERSLVEHPRATPRPSRPQRSVLLRLRAQAAFALVSLVGVVIATEIWYRFLVDPRRRRLVSWEATVTGVEEAVSESWIVRLASDRPSTFLLVLLMLPIGAVLLRCRRGRRADRPSPATATPDRSATPAP